MFGHYPTDILLSLSIFATALWTLLIFRSNIIITIFSLELLLLSNILGFTISGAYLNDIIGELFSVYILVIAAIETALGLSIILAYFRITNVNYNPAEHIEDIYSALIVTVAGYSLTIFTFWGAFYFLLLLLFIYGFMITPFMVLIESIREFILTFHEDPENMLSLQESLLFSFIPQPYRAQAWYFVLEPERYYNFYNPFFTKWISRGYKLQYKQIQFIGTLWSIINLEFIPSRCERIAKMYFDTFHNADAMMKDHVYHLYVFNDYYTWLDRYVAEYTIAGRRYLELKKEHLLKVQAEKQKEVEVNKLQEEIERLKELCRVKDAYISIYTADFNKK